MYRLLILGLLLSAPVFAQHDPGRNAVRELAKGDFAKAEKIIAAKSRRMNSPADAAEKAVVRCISACLQNDGASALKHAKDAVAAGAQFSRFQAGPQATMKPLYEANGYAEWAASQRKALVHGPMIGSVLDTSANIWVRTAMPESVVIEIKGDGRVLRLTGKTTPETDLTTVIKAEKLKPSSAYEVAVLLNGKTVATGSFRTTAPKGSPITYTMVLGGGAGFTPKYERVWAGIESHKPDALFLLGDNVYIDDPTHPLTNHYCYYRRQSQPEWRSLVAKTPVYAIYDDHDFGMNDCIPGPFIDKPEWKRPVWQTFRNNWANPAYGGGDAQPGCWFDFQAGDIHFIFLDCRYYRDRNGGTMLGPVQTEWFLSTLKNSKATIKVLASSVPWSAGVKPGSRDTWDGYPAEREKIFSFIEQHKIDGVVLISADRHRIDVRKTNRPNGYALYDFMSSRLTNVHTHGLVENAKGSEFVVGYNKTPGYAKLTFDTVTKPASVTCEIFDIDNALKETVKVTTDQLRH